MLILIHCRSQNYTIRQDDVQKLIAWKLELRCEKINEGKKLSSNKQNKILRNKIYKDFRIQECRERVRDNINDRQRKSRRQTLQIPRRYRHFKQLTKFKRKKENSRRNRTGQIKQLNLETSQVGAKFNRSDNSRPKSQNEA